MSKINFATLISSLSLIAVGLASTTAVAQSPLPPCNPHFASGFFIDCARQTFSNGDRYVGETLFGKPNGLGTYTSSDGTKYVGEFEDGKINGRGTYTYNDGSEYVGEWRDGKPNGQGTYTDSEGNKHVGKWRDGKKNGQGTEILSDGKTWSGIWKDGVLVSRSTNAGIPVEIQGGTAIVSVTINGKLTLDFIIDSGATDVVVPADVVLTLIRTGSITRDDFLGQQQYQLADGSTVPSPVFVIRSLKVGDKVLENVRASVASVNGSLLLGKFGLSSRSFIS
jgi:hypothetical protein